MSFMENVRSIASKFNSASPLSAISQEDVENCKKLSEATGLSWTPVSVWNPLSMGSSIITRDVYYRGFIYDRVSDGSRDYPEGYASAASRVIGSALRKAGPEGELLPYISSQVTLFDTPYVEIERTGPYNLIYNLMNRLKLIDADELRSDVVAALDRKSAEFEKMRPRTAEVGVHHD
ncbi:MAG: hypothetical protein ACOY4D_03070 [Pseudomonadota bacterium]